MRIKIYKDDWYFNMGIVGFLDILYNAGMKNQVIVNEDNIEFDSTLLENFHNYYFDYFMKKDDIYKRISKKIDQKIVYIKQNPAKMKSILSQLKSDISYENNKVKNYFKEESTIISNALKEFKNIKSKDDIPMLEELTLTCKQVFKLDYVNEKLTLNKIRSYLNSDFFGQASFLQPSRAKLSKDEQVSLMHRDYISYILEYSKIIELINNNDLDSLRKYIDLIMLKKKNQNKKSSKKSSLDKIIKGINKLLKNNKDISTIHNYLQSGDLEDFDDEECNLDSCDMCCNQKGLTSKYSEQHFGPLALSAKNSLNIFWNMNLNIDICDLCKLILFCTPAGATHVQKNYIKDTDKDRYLFVNTDTSICDIYDTNKNLKNSKDGDFPFKDLVFDIVMEHKIKSSWQLQNILFVEFKAGVGENKMCKMDYFNIPTYLAKFFVDNNGKNTKLIQSIYNKDFKNNVIDLLLKNQNLTGLINNSLKRRGKNNLDIVKDTEISASDCYKAIEINATINSYKNGVYDMDNKKVRAARYAGNKIRDYYIKNNSENKLNGIMNRLMHRLNANNRKDFMSHIIELFIDTKCEPPFVITDMLSENDSDFTSLGQAFISGLIHENYETKNNDK